MLMEGYHVGGKKVSTKEKRWYKDVGLGFKTPAEAIQGTYIGMFMPHYCPLADPGKPLHVQTRSAPSPAMSLSVAAS